MGIVRSLVALATAASVAGAQAKKEPIADNSFLVEEAYNQDPGVIQHISLFQKPTKGTLWWYTFTEEWPVGGQKNQFSVTVPYLNSRLVSGLRDVMVNWRYQLVGKEGEDTWVAPRLSLSLPTGDNDKGVGSGGVGWQFAVPLSHRWNDEIVSHTNVGLTSQPNAKAGGVKYSSTDLNLGQSFIWQPEDRFNLMLEATWERLSTTVGPISTHQRFGYVSPGARWGWDFSSGLQIIQGIAFPLGFADAKHDNSVVVYLSFEHPLRSKK